jgi:hypothetical protein
VGTHRFVIDAGLDLLHFHHVAEHLRDSAPRVCARAEIKDSPDITDIYTCKETPNDADAKRGRSVGVRGAVGRLI